MDDIHIPKAVMEGVLEHVINASQSNRFSYEIIIDSIVYFTSQGVNLEDAVNAAFEVNRRASLLKERSKLHEIR